MGIIEFILTAIVVVIIGFGALGVGGYLLMCLLALPSLLTDPQRNKPHSPEPRGFKTADQAWKSKRW